MIKKLIFVLISLPFLVLSQDQSNIIPNPSFEKIDKAPLGWFYNGNDFSEVMNSWSSPTSASPDFYNPNVVIPKSWKEKNFGSTKPRTDNSMVGITVYGCNKGKAHCKEYIQNTLNESLVIGQNYYLEFYIKHLPKTKYVNNIAASFSMESIHSLSDSLLTLRPVFETDHLSINVDNNWTKIAGTFLAKRPFQNIIIGCFYKDEDTKTISSPNDLGYSYYYIDDVLLKKINPIIQIPIPENPKELLIGKTYSFREILFKTNQSRLKLSSFPILDNIARLMKLTLNIKIEIQGHTDNVGTLKSNQLLSQRRTTTVLQYLVNKGIDKNRLTFNGFGESRPVASNETIEGRRLNRRVDFLILPLN